MHLWTAEARGAAWNGLNLRSKRGLNAKFSERCLMYVYLITSFSNEQLDNLKIPYGKMRQAMGSSGDAAAASPSDAGGGAVVPKKSPAWVQAFELAKGRVRSRRPDSFPQVGGEGSVI